MCSILMSVPGIVFYQLLSTLWWNVVQCDGRANFLNLPDFIGDGWIQIFFGFWFHLAKYIINSVCSSDLFYFWNHHNFFNDLLLWTKITLYQDVCYFQFLSSDSLSSIFCSLMAFASTWWFFTFVHIFANHVVIEPLVYFKSICF